MVKMAFIFEIGCLLVLLSSLVLVDTKHPGLQARITANGFNYVNTVAMETLAARIASVTLPERSGSDSGVKWRIYNIRVTYFERPASTLRTNPGSGLIWNGNGARIGFHGDFKLRILLVKTGGDFNLRMGGMSFSIGLNMGADSGGRPTIRAVSCSSDIGDVRVDFHGGPSVFINLFRGQIANNLKNQLKGKLCDILNRLVNEDARVKLETLPVSEKLGAHFLLDYGLIDNPQFTQDYMQIQHKAEFRLATASTKEACIEAPPMPEVEGTDRMLYIWLSDYIFNTAALLARHSKYTQAKFSSKDCNETSRGKKKDDFCEVFQKMGKLLVGKKHQHSSVDIDMYLDEPFRMRIGTDGIRLGSSLTLNTYARTTSNSREHIMTLSGPINVTMDAAFSEEKIYGVVTSLKLNFAISNSTIEYNPTTIKWLNIVLPFLLYPKINELGGKGFPLSLFKNVKLVNPKLFTAEHALVIATDVQYEPVH